MYVKLYLLITSGECNEVSDDNKQSSARQCAGGLLLFLILKFLRNFMW